MKEKKVLTRENGHKQRGRNGRDQLNSAQETIKLKNRLESNPARSRQKF